MKNKCSQTTDVSKPQHEMKNQKPLLINLIEVQQQSKRNYLHLWEK